MTEIQKLKLEKNWDKTFENYTSRKNTFSINSKNIFKKINRYNTYITS